MSMQRTISRNMKKQGWSDVRWRNIRAMGKRIRAIRQSKIEARKARL